MVFIPKHFVLTMYGYISDNKNLPGVTGEIR